MFLLAFTIRWFTFSAEVRFGRPGPVDVVGFDVRGVEVGEGAGYDEAPVAALGYCMECLVIVGMGEENEKWEMMVPY